MISLSTIFIIIFLHWIFDFLCQSDYMAMNKSKSGDVLLLHTVVYSILWLLPIALLIGPVKAIIFTGITLIIHTITDYCTARLTSRLYSLKLYRLFFNVIGMDQVLHYIQLFGTYYLLSTLKC